MVDITNSLNQGAEFERGLTNDERKTAAYNALSNTYGVALAGDPDTALKDQEFTQREQTNPIAVKQAQSTLAGTDLENAGKTESNKFNALADPFKLTALSDANANTEATTAQTKANTNRTNALLPGELTQQTAQTGLTRAQTGLTGAETAHTKAETAQSNFTLNTAQAAQQRTTAMGLLAGLSDTAANNGDIGAAFDKVAPLIAQYEGVTPDHLQGLRAQLVADPTGTINKLSTAIQAANLQAAGGKGATGALNMLKFSQGQMNLADGLQFTRQRIAAVPDLTQQALDLLPQMSSLATVRKAKAAIPGTPEYQFNAIAHQIQGNLSLDDLRSLREGGLSLGRTNLAEFAASANAIANTDLGLDPAMIRGNLQRVQNTYKGTITALDSQIARARATGGGARVASPQYVAGQQYKDAKGNVATWDGTKFVPAK
jgi:hypothetical protein